MNARESNICYPSAQVFHHESLYIAQTIRVSGSSILDADHDMWECTVSVAQLKWGGTRHNYIGDPESSIGLV